jgi:hypothetical protein
MTALFNDSQHGGDEVIREYRSVLDVESRDVCPAVT